MPCTWQGPTDARGREHGRGAWVFDDGTRDEGECVEGERHGRWVLAWADGSRREGEYVGGVKRGAWVQTESDGTRAEGEYVEGETTDWKKHGRWVTTRPDGTLLVQHWEKGTAVGDEVVWRTPPTHPPPPPPNSTHQQRPSGPIRQSGPRVRAEPQCVRSAFASRAEIDQTRNCGPGRNRSGWHWQTKPLSVRPACARASCKRSGPRTRARAGLQSVRPAREPSCIRCIRLTSACRAAFVRPARSS